MIKNIWVYGMGGVGGHFGGRLCLAAEKGAIGAKVFFVARGTHLAAIRQNGLKLVWPGGRQDVCRPEAAVDGTDSLPSPDLCLLCVKSFDLDAAAADIARRAGRDTVVMPLLNGVTICERVRRVCGKGVVLPSCVFVVALKTADGTVACQGGEGVMFSGRDPRFPERDFPQLRELFSASGIDLRWQDDALPPVWKKYVFIAAFGMVTAAYSKTFGQVMADPAIKGLAVGIMEEIKALAVARGVDIDPQVVDWALLNAGKLPFSTTTSFQRDVMAGEKAEDDIFSGDLLALGRESGLDMPTTRAVAEELKRVRTGGSCA